jgi:hypothetical protein
MLVFAQFDQADQQLGNLQNALEQMQQKLGNLGGGLGGLGGGGGGVAGLMSYLPWVALAWIAFLVMRRGGGPTLALDDFEINPTARVKNGTVIRIEGRKKGPIAKLFSLMNLDPSAKWTATRDSVQFEDAGLFGKTMTIVPMRQINVIRTEHGLPKLMMLVAAIVIIAGLINFASGMGKIACLVGIVLAVNCFFNRRFVISVEAGVGGRVAIAVQPSMLGGPSFDLGKLEEAGRLLQKLVRTAERGKEDREPDSRGSSIPLAPFRAIESAQHNAPPPSPRIAEPSPIPEDDDKPLPVQPMSVFQPDGPPKPRPMKANPKPKPKPKPHVDRLNLAQQGGSNEEKLAAEAFDAAVRVFESKRPGEAEAAWWALVRRWPNTTAAKRARRILDNRAKKERKGK